MKDLVCVAGRSRLAGDEHHLADLFVSGQDRLAPGQSGAANLGRLEPESRHANDDRAARRFTGELSYPFESFAAQHSIHHCQVDIAQMGDE